MVYLLNAFLRHLSKGIVILVLSTATSAAILSGQIQNTARPIDIYLVDTQSQVVIQRTPVSKQGRFRTQSIPPGLYAIVFRLQYNPAFPLDYADAIVPVIRIVSDYDFGPIQLEFDPGHRTQLSDPVDAYLGLDQLMNLDNVLIYRESQESQDARDRNLTQPSHPMKSAPTPYGTGDLRM